MGQPIKMFVCEFCDKVFAPGENTYIIIVRAGDNEKLACNKCFDSHTKEEF